MSEVGGDIGWMAAHAPTDKHDAEAGKRDKAYAAFQMALSKIDPTNPAVAQPMIDKVKAAVQGLQKAVKSSKTAVEKALESWQKREPELDQWMDRVREMVDWGYDKASAIQKVCDAIAQKANDRKYEDAEKGLVGMLPKVGPLFDDYQKQVDAQQEYDQHLPDLEPRLECVGTATFEELEEEEVQLSTLATQMRDAAEQKDYVAALELLGQLRERVERYESRVKELEQLKSDYEQLRSSLDDRLSEASTSQYASLSELDQRIVEVVTRTDQAAEATDYQSANEQCTALSDLVDEKLSRVAELDGKRVQVETTRAAMEPRFSDASTSEHPELATLDNEIVGLSTQIDEAVASEDYDVALTAVGELGVKVDEKLKKRDELDAKKAYEKAAAAEEANFKKADGTDPDKHFELTKHQKSYQDGKKSLDGLVKAESWSDALAKLPEIAALATAYVELRKAYDDYKAAEKKAAADINYLDSLNDQLPPGDKWDAELTLYKQMINNYHTGKFAEALATMKTLLGKIADLKKRVAESDKKTEPIATAATEEIRKLAGGKDVSKLTAAESAELVKKLKKLSPAKQRELLEQMHGPSSALSTEQRHMQAAMFKAMDLDKEFKKADAKVRDKYQQELQKDKELKEAVTNWNRKDDKGNPLVDLETKQKMLQKVLETQSKAYGIDVPEIEWYAGKAGDFGGFSANTTRISLNTRYINNAEEMINTIIHENTHNYQDELVKQFVAGKIKKDDPRYEQAKTFAVTHHWDAYENGDIDSAAYKAQPEEMHAWDAGDTEAKELVQSFKKPKKKK